MNQHGLSIAWKESEPTDCKFEGKLDIVSCKVKRDMLGPLESQD